MHTNEPREDPLVDMGYETKDINVNGIKWGAGIFFAFTAVMGVLGVGILHLMNPDLYNPPKAKHAREMPQDPNPLLQSNVTVRVDTMQLRQDEEKRLESQGPNPDGSYHIPIERALAIIAERGIPKTGKSVSAISKGNTTDQRKDTEVPGVAVRAPDKTPPPKTGGKKP